MDLVTKLQIRSGQKIQLAHAPDTVVNLFDRQRLTRSSAGDAALVMFVRSRADVVASRTRAVEAASRDRLTWIAYPKAGQLDTDLSRDSLAEMFSTSGVRPVRQVAIDDVWSALRFRPA